MAQGDVTVVEIGAYDPIAASEITLRYADGDGFDPADETIGVYDPRLIDPGNLEEFLFRRGHSIGLNETGKGRIKINNPDGELDILRTYGYGRDVTIRRGEIESANPANLTTIFSGTSLGRLDRSELEIGIDVTNKLGEIYDLPYSTVKYDGDEADATYGSGGHVNGTADTIKGKNRPYLFGNGGGENYTIPLVNPTKQTLQISQNEITSITTIWNGGAAQTAGTSHANLTALQAATVTGGQYDYYLGDDAKDVDDPERGAYIRIGGSIDGDITAKAVESSSSLVNAIKAVLEQKDITPDATSFSDLNTKINSVGGIFIDIDEIKTGEVINKMMEGINAFLCVTVDGTFKIGRVESPSGLSSVLTLEKDQLLGDEKVQRFPSNDQNGDTPASQIIYNFNKNYTKQGQADVPGATSAERVEFLKHEYRSINKDAAAGVITKHPKAVPFVINSLLTDSTEANTEADRQKTLRTTEREFAQIIVHEKFVRSIELGDTITVTDDRYSDTGSDKWLVLGKIYEYAEGEITFIIWK